MQQRSLSDEPAVRRRHILTPEEQAAADVVRAKQSRLRRIRRTYAGIWCVLLLPVCALSGWLASQASLWLLGLMIVSVVVVKPITALIAIERLPRTDEDDDHDAPEIDIAEIEAVNT